MTFLLRAFNFGFYRNEEDNCPLLSLPEYKCDVVFHLPRVLFLCLFLAKKCFLSSAVFNGTENGDEKEWLLL